MKINTEMQQQCVNSPLNSPPTTILLQSNQRGKDGKWVIATHSVSAFVSNYFHLSFIVSAVRDTCSGINDVGRKKGEKEMPMDTLKAALTGPSWKWWQVDGKWQISGCLSRRRRHWAATFISFSCAGSWRSLVSASLRSAFPLLPAQLCTHGFSWRGRKKGELCARNESAFVFCVFFFLFFVAMDKYWVIILTHIHLRLTQPMLASIPQLPTFEMKTKSRLAISALQKYDCNWEIWCLAPMNLPDAGHTTSPSPTLTFTCWLKTISSNSTWSDTWWKGHAKVQKIRMKRKWITG